MTHFPDACVDLILCDLPYATTQNKWDSVIDLKGLWDQYRRILKPNGAIVLSAPGVFTAKLILSNEKWFKYKLVWEKSKPTNFLNAKKQPLRKHEDICVFYGQQPTYNLQMGEGVGTACPSHSSVSATPLQHALIGASCLSIRPNTRTHQPHIACTTPSKSTNSALTLPPINQLGAWVQDE